MIAYLPSSIFSFINDMQLSSLLISTHFHTQGGKVRSYLSFDIIIKYGADITMRGKYGDGTSLLKLAASTYGNSDPVTYILKRLRSIYIGPELEIPNFKAF